MASARLELLGGFRLSSEDDRIIDVPAKKNRMLLGCLALAPKFETTRDRLSALLWADRGEEQARSSLRQAIAALRKDMAPAGSDLLVFTGDRVALNIRAIGIDVSAFLDAAGGSDLASLRRAAALYKGPFLDGLIAEGSLGDWLRETRHDLAARAAAALETLTRMLVGPERIAFGQTLVQLDPLHEASHRTLIEAHLAEGEKDLARKQFEVCKRILKRELGVEPSDELRVLVLSSRGKTNGATPPHGLDRKPVIAVLPFENMSGQSAPDYFSDGITEDIIDRLSRFRTLSVIGRHSSFAFRDRMRNGGSIKDLLKADYVVTGSIRKSESRIRVAVRLSDVESDAAIWAERYDRPLEDIFDLQDEVAHVIASTLVGRLETEITTRSQKKHPSRLSSYEYLLQGCWHFDRLSPSTNDVAITCFERALELDPHNADAKSWLASAFLCRWWVDLESRDLAKAVAITTEAVLHDPANFNCHRVLALAQLLVSGVEAARPAMMKAIALNPGAPIALAEMALIAAYEGDVPESRRWLDQAFRLNPLHPFWYNEMGGIASFIEGDYEAVLPVFEAIPDGAWHMMYLLSCCGHLGLEDKAKACLARFRANGRNPDFLLGARAERYRNSEPRDRLIAGLETALTF